MADVSLESQGVTEFTETVKDALSGFGREFTPRRCCISAAGPVEDGRLSADEPHLDYRQGGFAEGTRDSTIVINDFLALSYSLPLLDISDSSQVIPLPHPDGTVPSPEGGSYAIIGAGTGLGGGTPGTYRRPLCGGPFEGGHTDFPAFDKETQRLETTSRFASTAGREPNAVLSGQGIANIYSFVRSSLSGPVDEILHEIDSLPDRSKPALIAANGKTNPHCRRVMELFTRIYGKFAATRP